MTGWFILVIILSLKFLIAKVMLQELATAEIDATSGRCRPSSFIWCDNYGTSIFTKLCSNRIITFASSTSIHNYRCFWSPFSAPYPTKSRLSTPVLPLSPTFPETSSSILAHWSSRNIILAILASPKNKNVNTNRKKLTAFLKLPCKVRLNVNTP